MATIIPTVCLLVLLLLGCAAKEEPLPPVPPSPEDLSTWSVPELVQPPPPDAPATTPPKEQAPTPAEQVLDFASGTTFRVTVPVGAPLDIILGHHEQMRNIIGTSDMRIVRAGQPAAPAPNETPAKWQVSEGGDGYGESFRQHLFLLADQAGLTTGLLITTTYRTYYLTCKSVGTSPMRTVRWRYPADPVVVQPVKEPGLLPDPAQPKHYHVGYELVGTKPTWQPRQVVDDGKKTYILYPERALFETVPMMRLVGPHGPQLVNSRQFLNVVIVDQLVGRAELRIGRGEHAEVVTITRGMMRTIACPGDEACPVWPAAAQILAQRAPPVQPPPQVQPPTQGPGQAPTPRTRPPPPPPVRPHRGAVPPPPEGGQP
jgi:type IV secretion system protein TrbG